VRIPAAGTVPWRVTAGTLEVALVHRPRYDDWSWAKGKLDKGEEWPIAATRETAEETGLEVRLGLPLPESRYTVLDRLGSPDEKVVRYWAAQVTGGHGRLINEIDEVAWLDAQGAFDRLDYSRDRDQLLAVVRAHQLDLLDTHPFVLVRHAKAVARSDYKGKRDWLRPLDDVGFARSGVLADILAAYGITRVVTSSATRCSQTVEPYAARAGLPVRRKRGLSEEGFDEQAAKAPRILRREFERGVPVAVCSHGPVLPALVDELTQRMALDIPGAVHMVELLSEARDDRLIKGEALVCHVTGIGSDARIVAVERHVP
jgi:8-oxo-dGTP diphosphatase